MDKSRAQRNQRVRAANKACSIARVMAVIGDRWSLLVLREAYYGTRRFDEFEYQIGVAPNILSNRLKKFVDAGLMQRVRSEDHARYYEYHLTKKGRAFFPAYLALKKWGDDWLADVKGTQVLFREKGGGPPVKVPPLLTSAGTPLDVDDTEVVAGSGATPFNKSRFGGS